MSLEESLHMSSMWRNRPFYTSSRAVCHHLKSSGRFRSSDSAKPVVRRESRKTSMNQITRINMHSRNSRRSSHNDYNTRELHKHNSFSYKPGLQNKGAAEETFKLA